MGTKENVVAAKCVATLPWWRPFEGQREGVMSVQVWRLSEDGTMTDITSTALQRCSREVDTEWTQAQVGGLYAAPPPLCVHCPPRLHDD